MAGSVPSDAIETTTHLRTGRLALRLALFAGVTGAAGALSVPAFASVVQSPAITSTKATFAIPSGSTSTWTLRLWSHGTMEGSAHGTSGTLSVAVPATSDCFFQADVSVVAQNGQSYFYSGSRATVPGCGSSATIAGDIDLCSASGSPTTTEVPGGTLAASGSQSVAQQSNPLAPTKVPAGPYTVTAGAPSGYVFVTCGGPSTVDASGVTASQSVVVPAGGAGSGTFYVVVAAPVGSLNGGGAPGSGNGGTSPNPSSSPGNPSPAAVLAQQSKPTATPVHSGSLAFTGLSTAPLLVSGLLALAFGLFATNAARNRRRAGRRPAHARR